MAKQKDIPVGVDELLAAEYDYIAQTAAQANEDRASVVSFFLIAVGSPLAAFFSTNLVDNNNFDYSFLFCGLFLLLTVLGTTTIMQLARLRAAWYESMLAMNHMKEFIIKNTEFDISGAFRWRMTTAPAKFKVNSVNFYQAIEVAILTGLLFAAFIFFLLTALHVQNGYLVWGLSAALGLLTIRIEIFLYQRFIDLK